MLLKITSISSICSVFCVFLHCAGLWIFHPALSSESLCFIHSAEYVELVFWCLFSAAFQAPSGWSHLSLLSSLLVVSCPFPLVTAYWWNKLFLTAIRIFITFSHRNLCSLFYPYVVFLLTQHLYAMYKYS